MACAQFPYEVVGMVPAVPRSAPVGRRRHGDGQRVGPAHHPVADLALLQAECSGGGGWGKKFGRSADILVPIALKGRQKDVVWAMVV